MKFICKSVGKRAFGKPGKDDWLGLPRNVFHGANTSCYSNQLQFKNEQRAFNIFLKRCSYGSWLISSYQPSAYKIPENFTVCSHKLLQAGSNTRCQSYQYINKSYYFLFKKKWNESSPRSSTCHIILIVINPESYWTTKLLFIESVNCVLNFSKAKKFYSYTSKMSGSM